jgi:deoxyribodipyrimidine photo-lyase
MKQPVTIFWFRRDLRLQDTCGLSAALSGNYPVVPIFIFDTAILDQLSAEDARVTFIHKQLNRLNSELAKYHTSLLTYYGTVQSALEKVCARFIVKSVYCNHDYEPYARKRDSSTKKWLGARGVDFRSFKDQVIYEKNEVLKQDGAPYTVFTAYMKKWKSTLNTEPGILEPNKLVSNFVAIEPQPMVSLKSLGFNKQVLNFPPANEPVESTISRYSENRDFPAKQGTTRLSVHLRFGTVSIRSLVRIALNQSETWLNELIWREFYMMILWHFPYVVDGCFKMEYDFIPWKNNEQEFERWCNGETGYPFVDAGMRELNETGFRHNRLRMVTASFLSKHLLINWQWGEA